MLIICIGVDRAQASYNGTNRLPRIESVRIEIYARGAAISSGLIESDITELTIPFIVGVVVADKNQIINHIIVIIAKVNANGLPLTCSSVVKIINTIKGVKTINIDYIIWFNIGSQKIFLRPSYALNLSNCTTSKIKGQGGVSTNDVTISLSIIF